MRSEQDLPYTNTGSVLVSVNPLHSLPDRELEPGRAMQTSVPHPYSIAETSFRNMTFCLERRQRRLRQLAILERGGHDVREERKQRRALGQPERGHLWRVGSGKTNRSSACSSTP
jgi:hypothetical protein